MDASINQLIERIKLAARGQRKGDEANAPPKLGEILTVTGKTTPEALSKVLDAQKKEPDASSVKLGEMLVKTATVSAKEIAHALRTQTAAEAQQHAIAVHEVVRVDAQRLDRIVDNIGELVIAVSMVRQSVLLGGDGADLGRQLGHLDKITRELQEMGTSLRMVPVRPVFQKMARLARDVAKKIGKQVEFVTFGDDTELDKAVVDRISDPLVHMVRNAIDHGLESDPVDRHKLGKAEVGRVELRAFHKAGNIHIEISDDGRGLDREAIRRKAIERGIIADSEILTDREIFALIFQPGFSTAKQVTDVSGRGVGMDVVKRNIEALRGRVEVQSEMGRGSCFSISLPLTLAIIDGMVIRVGQERYIVPTLSIVTSLRPEPASICTVLKRGEMLSFQDELIPLVRVHEIFDIPHGDRDDRNIIVVIIENEGRKTGLVIDELIGQQQIVIKSLGESLRGMPGITGGAIMPDGRVGLILDVGGLVKLSHAARPSLHEEQPGFEEELALAGAGA
jgi:two-component system chemotaxis sensor kinase CheA